MPGSSSWRPMVDGGATAAAMGTHFFGGARGGASSMGRSEAAGLARSRLGVVEPAGRYLARAEVGDCFPERETAYRTSSRATRIYKATTATSPSHFGPSPQRYGQRSHLRLGARGSRVLSRCPL